MSLIKASIKAGAQPEKWIEYLNDDLWVFYAHGAAGSEKISYKMRSEAYAVERDLTPPAGQKFYHIYGVVCDIAFVYVVARTVASGVAQVVQISPAHAQTLKTTTHTPTNDCTVFCPADTQIAIYDGLFPGTAGTDSVLYSFTPNTFSILTQPAEPGDTPWSVNKFKPTRHLDKIYFQFMSYKNQGSWGQSHFLYFDIATSTLMLEIFEYGFDAKFTEGYAKVFTCNGLAASGNSLLMNWAICCGASDNFPIDMLDTDYFRVYSFIIIKDLITGKWMQYQETTEENWWPNSYVQIAGAIQRGAYIFLKTTGSAGDIITGLLENLGIGANYTQDGIFKNYYNPIVAPEVQKFCIPETTIPCFLPISYVKTNAGNADLYVDEFNFIGVPPKPLYLTTLTQWDTSGFRLYCNYRGFEDPYSMEIDIDTAAGVGVVSRTVVGTNTYVEILASDGLTTSTEYKWRCRFYDSCGNAGTWSDFAYFWIRDTPLIVSQTITAATQRPDATLQITDYGCEIDTVQITINLGGGGANVWTSPVLKAQAYYNAITDRYVIPIDTHGLILTATSYDYLATIANIKGRSTSITTTQTNTFVSPADPATLTPENQDGWVKLTWPTVGGATGYRIYRTINGIKTYLGDTTDLLYNDLTIPMITQATYTVATKTAIAQSAGITAQTIIQNFQYALICESDYWSIYFKVQSELGYGKDNNLESVGDHSRSKCLTGAGSLQMWISQPDFLQFESRQQNGIFYLKVKNEVYKIKISNFQKTRETADWMYLVLISFVFEA